MDYYPSAIKKADYDTIFGNIDEEVMLLSITRLINDGLVEQRAIIRLLRGPDINLSQLKLTVDGYEAISAGG
jgi:hypothetical protein